MIKIDKNREPSELETYRLKKTLNPSFENMHGVKLKQINSDWDSDKDLYKIVLDALAKEQGYICAYCMRRIPEKKVVPSMTIEHINPQHMISEEEKLEYTNMVAVCNGYRNSRNNKNKTCDAKRGSLPLEKQKLILNPLDEKSLRRISYSESGKIKPADESDEEAKNCIENVLNLNCKNALKTLQEKIFQECKGKAATKEQFEKYLELYKNKNNKDEYIGILIWWLEKKVRR